MLTKHDRNQAPSSLKQLKAFEDFTLAQPIWRKKVNRRRCGTGGTGQCERSHGPNGPISGQIQAWGYKRPHWHQSERISHSVNSSVELHGAVHFVKLQHLELPFLNFTTSSLEQGPHYFPLRTARKYQFLAIFREIWTEQVKWLKAIWSFFYYIFPSSFNL